MAIHSTRWPRLASNIGVSGAILLLISHVVEHDRELLLRQDVAATADDQRAVEPLGHAGRAVVGAHRVVVVVPVTGAARHPPPARRGGHLPGSPDVGPGLAGVVERGVERAAVGVGAVVDPVRMDGQALVRRVDQGDLEGVALPHLQHRPRHGRLAGAQPVAEEAAGQRLGIDGDLSRRAGLGARRATRECRADADRRRGETHRTSGHQRSAGHRVPGPVDTCRPCVSVHSQALSRYGSGAHRSGVVGGGATPCAAARSGGP